MQFRGVRLVLLIALLALSAGGAAAASAPTRRLAPEAQRFAANNSLFVIYHEMAHLLVDQMNLPVLGKEEDAADNMATWTLLNKHSPKADQALIDAAYGWVLTGIAYDSGGLESDFYAAHSLDRQRAYQIVCLMVGDSMEKFGQTADDYEMDLERQDACQADYRLVNRSLRGLIGKRASQDTAPTRVKIDYRPAGPMAAAAALLKQSGVFEQVANELRNSYHLMRPVTFTAKLCGEANSFYDADTVEIIYCYELMDDFISLYKQDVPGGKTAPGTRRGERLRDHRDGR